MTENRNLYAIIITLIIISLVLAVGIVVLLFEPEDTSYVNPYKEVLDKNKNYTQSINAILNETDNSLRKYRQNGNITQLSNANQYLSLAMNTHLSYYQWYNFNISNNPEYEEIYNDILSGVYFYDKQIEFRMIDVTIEMRNVQ